MPVTREQAAEIIVRTSGLDFFTNDRAWERALWRELGVELEEGQSVWRVLSAAEKEDIKRKYGILDLYYLRNHRIVSTWVGGPHGWCDWDGTIGCGNYNIGKCPSIEEIDHEWRIIAEAFPYLNLKAQVYSGETSEEDIHPVVEWTIKDGQVEIGEPTYEIPIDPNYALVRFVTTMGSITRERGCSLEQFRLGLDMAERAVRENQKTSLKR